MKSSTGDPLLTIGQLAARFGLATHVLRHWESAGLLTPAVRVSGQRRYQKEHIARVAMIVRGKQVGFSLAELREMIEAPDPAARRAILSEKVDALTRLHDEIVASKAMIDHALSCPAHDFTQCPNFQRLVDTLNEGSTMAEAISAHDHQPRHVCTGSGAARVESGPAGATSSAPAT